MAASFARLLAAVALASLTSEATCRPASAQARSLRHVLTIHAGAVEYPVNQALDAAIRKSLLSHPREPIEYFAEYLEVDRFPEIDSSLAFRDYIARKYAGRRIDLVIAVTNRSLRFVLEHGRELFPDAPIVFGSLTLPDQIPRGGDHRITGVRFGSAFPETLKLALELHPGTEQVFVVAASPNERSVHTVRAELRDVAPGVKLTYVVADTVPRLLAAVKAIPRRSVILYIWYQGRGPDYIMYPEGLARLVAEAATVPVYGAVDANIGTGIVGGMVRGTHQSGARVGEMALQILNGTRAQDIPVENARLVPTFDWRQLQRWGIDPSRLPPGSDIRFRPPTAWESYRAYIIGTGIIVSAQLLLIAGLLAQRGRRRRAEETIRTREATLRISYERIRQLAGRLINAEEAARAEIARNLHDDVCQELIGCSIEVSNLRRSLRTQDAQVEEGLSTLQHRTLSIVEGVRRLSHDLHPATLRLLGLAAALQAHCIEVEKRHDVQVAFRTDGDLGQIPLDIGLCLFRIAQEALRNGAVHGDARRLAVSLARSETHVELTVTDDGRGFDLEAVRRERGGLGLVSMEERAHVAGGNARFITRPGQGTTIRVRCPAGTSVEPEKVVQARGGALAPRAPEHSMESL